MTTCSCGFVHESVTDDEVADRVTGGVSAISELLLSHPDDSTHKPSVDRWSMLEYAAHVRDVMLTLRDRIVIGLVEEDPEFKPMYRDERIELGLYRAETPTEVAPELEAAAAMFTRLFSAVEPSSLDRTVEYGYPGPATRTIRWMAQQAVHETEHHLTDIQENLEGR